MKSIIIIDFFKLNAYDKNKFFINKNITNINNNNFEKPLNSSKFIQNKKNLVFGIIQKCSLKRILPFINSLIKTNFKNWDMIIFIRYISKKIIGYLRNIGVIVYEIPKQY